MGNVPRRRTSYSTSDLADLAEGLQRLLDAIERGELTADASTISRLEGAAASLQALARGQEPRSPFTLSDD
jgi:ribosome-binding protein aMBF1 (putative translation factor)